MIEDDHEVQDYDPVVCAKSVSGKTLKWLYVLCVLEHDLLDHNPLSCLFPFLKIVLDLYQGRRNFERVARCQYMGEERRAHCHTA